MVEYRLIAGFEHYRVGDDGSIWCNRRRGCPGVKGPITEEWRQLNPRSNDSGHKTVTLGRNNHRFVHRLILEAFVGPCPEGMQCLHGNGNPEDNRLTNLRWGTPSDNYYDSLKHGTATFQKGVKHPQAVLTDEIAREIVALHKQGYLQRDIADRFKLNKTTVSSVLSGRSWSYATGIIHTPNITARKRKTRTYLTDEQVREVRRLRANGHTRKELAIMFNASRAMISEYTSPKSRRLPDELPPPA